MPSAAPSKSKSAKRRRYRKRQQIARQNGKGKGKGKKGGGKSSKGNINTAQRSKTKQGAAHMRLSGSDELGNIKLSNENTVEVIYEKLLNPSSFPGTRQAIFAGAFEKYRYTKATLEYIPACASTTGGQILMYYDTDPTDAPAATTTQGFAHIGAVKNNTFARTTMALPVVPGGPWFTGAVPAGESSKFYDQAKIVILPVVPANGPGIDAPVEIGSLTLHWELEFYNPQVSDSSTRASAVEYDWALATVSDYSSGPGINIATTGTIPGTFYGHPIVGNSISGGTDAVQLANVNGENDPISTGLPTALPDTEGHMFLITHNGSLFCLGVVNHEIVYYIVTDGMVAYLPQTNTSTSVGTAGAESLLKNIIPVPDLVRLTNEVSRLRDRLAELDFVKDQINRLMLGENPNEWRPASEFASTARSQVKYRSTQDLRP